ncbi:MAG TPA: ribonuclease domain-containing protein [Lacipirellulaceae bacterium]|nr:ribonuclease domain-containing protein [Lacipirellulaceae bacterium]
MALFLVLLLVMAWVYESQPADTGPAGKQTPLPPAPTQNDAATRQRPPLDRDSPAAPRPVASQRSAPIENDADATHPARSNTPRNAGLTVRNARVTDEDGSVIYRGDVDLGPTLDRIDRGKRLRFSHDGIVFENRERRLPQKPSGYYHEFVHPTPGDDGPGGQRVVLGREDEVYYTPDHYHTFRRVQ